MEGPILLIAALVVYLFVLVAIGGYTYRKGVSSPEDYFLAGRRLGAPVLGLAVMATTLSAWMMLGHQGQMWAAGLAYMANYAHILIMVIVAIAIWPRLWYVGRKFGFVTPGDMYGYYYQSDLTRLLIAILTILYAIPYVALQLVGASLVFDVLTEGRIGPTAGVLIAAGVVTFYVFLGGLRATALTSALQGLLLFVGVLLLGFGIMTSIRATEGVWGLGEIMSLVGAESPELMTLPVDPYTIVFTATFVLAGVGIYTSPVFHMWAFSARSPQIFRVVAVFFMGVLAALMYYVFSPLIGFGGRVLIPELESPDALTPTLMVEVLHPVAYMFVGVAILAAMMSTADANLNTTGAAVTRDFYRRFLNPEATTGQQVNFGRGVILLTVLGSLVLTFAVQDVITFIGAMGTSFGLLLAMPLIGATYVRWLTPAGVNAGMIGGAVTVVLTYFVYQYPLGLHTAGWAAIVSVALTVGVSLVTKGRPDRVAEFHDSLEQAIESSNRRRDEAKAEPALQR